MPPARLSDSIHAERLGAQLLSGEPAQGAVEVAERLLAIQGQDQRGARLAVRARSAGLTAADVDRALTEDRSLLIAWLNRGTLHLVRSEDYPWLHALTAPSLVTANRRRLAQEGVTEAQAERGIAALVRALAEDGPLGRGALRERVAAADVPVEGQALIHLLARASIEGLIVRGPVFSGEHRYALVCDWIGVPPAIDRSRALAELARRYLRGHGPANDRDLARWAGLPLGEARSGLAAIAPELVERTGGLVALAEGAKPGDLPPPLLLGAFDPVLLGWCSREALLASHQGIVTSNGIFRPFALIDGTAAATWRFPRGAVEFEPLRKLRPAERAALAVEAADVARFLG